MSTVRAALCQAHKPPFVRLAIGSECSLFTHFGKPLRLYVQGVYGARPSICGFGPINASPCRRCRCIQRQHFVRAYSRPLFASASVPFFPWSQRAANRPIEVSQTLNLLAKVFSAKHRAREFPRACTFPASQLLKAKSSDNAPPALDDRGEQRAPVCAGDPEGGRREGRSSDRESSQDARDFEAESPEWLQCATAPEMPVHVTALIRELEHKAAGVLNLMEPKSKRKSINTARP